MSQHPDTDNYTDTAPIPASQRTWRWIDIGCVHAGIFICVPVYSLGGYLTYQLGLSLTQAALVLTCSSLMAFAVSIFCAEPSWKHGITPSMLLHALFGWQGARLPVTLRALGICGWFGVQTLFGAMALHQITRLLTTDGSTWGDASVLGFYGLFLLINLFICWFGNESVRRFEVLGTPLLLAVSIALFLWAIVTLDGAAFETAQSTRSPAGWPQLLQATAINLGVFGSHSLVTGDYSRFARQRRDYRLGQLVSFVSVPLLFEGLGAFMGVTSALLMDQQSADMVAFAGGLPVWLGLPALLVILLATLTTNTAGNIITSANDIMALSRLRYRPATLVTALLGTALISPELLRRMGLVPDTFDFMTLFTQFVSTYTSLFSVVIGILIVGYYSRHRQQLDLEALYDPQGCYRGWHWPACGVLLVMVGLVILSTQFDALQGLRQYGSLTNGVLGAAVYWLCLKIATLGRAVPLATSADKSGG